MRSDQSPETKSGIPPWCSWHSKAKSRIQLVRRDFRVHETALLCRFGVEKNHTTTIGQDEIKWRFIGIARFMTHLQPARHLSEFGTNMNGVRRNDRLGMRYRLALLADARAASTDTLIFLTQTKLISVNTGKPLIFGSALESRFPSVRSILERWRRSHGIL